MIPSRSIDFFEWKFIPVTFFCCCQEIGTYSKILEQLFHIVNVHRWSHFKSMCRFPCFQRKCYQKNWVCIKNNKHINIHWKNTGNYRTSYQVETCNCDCYIMIFAKRYIYNLGKLIQCTKGNYEIMFLHIHLVVYFIWALYFLKI